MEETHEGIRVIRWNEKYWQAFEKHGHEVYSINRIPDKLCEYIVELCEKG